MTMNKENQMNQIPLGVLQNVNEMLAFGDDVLSDEDGRLSQEELASLREEMNSKLDLAYEGFICKLENIYEIKLESKEFKMSVLSVFHDFGLKLIQKISTRYQNAHVKITFKTVTGYVCEEIQESEVTKMIDNIVELIQEQFKLAEKTSYVKDHYITKVSAAMKEQLKALEESFKSIEIPSENQEKKDVSNGSLDINNSKFVENTVEHVEYLLDNKGKKAMLDYIRDLAKKLVEANK
ncbi:hypothetical protein ADU90_13785 [Clostridium botulinum]|uniref:Uncharacterized protein n=3 Tax=Clostridium botulinum TaxID=1491 RepID=A0A0A0ICI4_CLOBO|nr:hypothetical protein [Clostridium botulinum]KGM99164.1 hypothetical protein Z955_08580 [Clostridium botulinum C/D str. DC5]KEI04388.1 hypothetical protein Z952_06875 [Clostridium botulinum C/D str. BKT75002]KEI11297.1 hypothetical protein Z954_08355 [Clostridium botulinum C/D str. BKT2873]KGM95215.1 hypothetical protein Z956_05325 [Clostridium botulinum D str. CCUG 7971]KOC46074.1 hypothetical protein ADU88_12535 [Clostridium botulinum]